MTTGECAEGQRAVPASTAAAAERERKRLGAWRALAGQGLLRREAMVRFVEIVRGAGAGGGGGGGR